jgi:hypothetical protein
MILLGYHTIALDTYEQHHIYNSSNILNSSLPILTINKNNSDIVPSTIITINNITIGVMSLTFHHNIEMKRIVNMILDESLCLRKKTDIVILISNNNKHHNLLSHIGKHTQNYIDLIMDGRNHSNNTCDGYWHTEKTMIVDLGDNNNNTYGHIQIYKTAKHMSIRNICQRNICFIRYILYMYFQFNSKLK